MIRFSKHFLLLGLLCGAVLQARAQDDGSSGAAFGDILAAPSGMIFSIDGGQMQTQFGNTALKTSQYAQRSSPFFNISLQINKDLTDSGSVFAGIKLEGVVPTDTSDATGNPWEVGVAALFGGGGKGITFDAGVDARDFVFPAQYDKKNSFNRDPELMFGIPAELKVKIKRFQVSGGGTYWIANDEDALLSDSTSDNTTTTQNDQINPTFITLSTTQASYDFKVAAAYQLSANHSAWLRFNYLNRQMHFALTGLSGTSDPYIMDFTQNQISGGIYWDLDFRDN